MKKENEINAVENRIKDEEVAKHTIKDSVFTNLFKEKKYLLQLYGGTCKSSLRQW